MTNYIPISQTYIPEGMIDGCGSKFRKGFPSRRKAEKSRSEMEKSAGAGIFLPESNTF